MLRPGELAGPGSAPAALSRRLVFGGLPFA